MMVIKDMRIRPMREEEVPCLADFLYDAIYQPAGADLLPRDVVWRPELAAYIKEFGRPGDFCLTAEAGDLHRWITTKSIRHSETGTMWNI